MTSKCGHVGCLPHKPRDCDRPCLTAPSQLTPGKRLWVVLEEQVHGVLALKHAMGVVHPAKGHSDVECWPQRLPHPASEVVTASTCVVAQIGCGASHWAHRGMGRGVGVHTRRGTQQPGHRDMLWEPFITTAGPDRSVIWGSLQKGRKDAGWCCLYDADHLC
jgi:hypothetical protein